MKSTISLMRKKGKRVMSETKELKKGNGEKPENQGTEEEENVEGYGYCSTHKQKCLNDCAFGGPAISHID